MFFTFCGEHVWGDGCEIEVRSPTGSTGRNLFKDLTASNVEICITN